ncbi:hypothetical protein B0A68_21770 [Flavobacterium reichenbachii]|uniref:Lipoprotein n=2 Tax=Flavobacterium reichenbachii TaxID=362418 RepID=A0A085ZE09_9FLAO|nr:hypothetical protein IW19_23700 [Flavobacterium reichenbachii]OXB10703.1 hypothetical protein B0A68_21770 [Flavobacterium reichenbachii]
MKTKTNINMNTRMLRAVIFLAVINLFASCTNDNMVSYYGEETNQPGKVTINAYSAVNDSLQIISNGKALEIGKDKKTAFTKKIDKEYDFVYYGDQTKTIEITNKVTKEVLHTYHFTAEKVKDTLSFFTKDGIWIDKITSIKTGVLSKPANSGYRFIFPNINKYSKSGYEGNIDGIIRKINGQLLGVAENINKDKFNPFIEFPFSSPPTILMELVKHGTTESYIPGQKIIVIMTMSVNKSKLIVLEEKSDASGIFTGVDGTLNLTDYFVFK